MGVSPVDVGSSLVLVRSGPGSENLTRLFLDFGVRATGKSGACCAGEAQGDCLVAWPTLRRVRRSAMGRSAPSSIFLQKFEQ